MTDDATPAKVRPNDGLGVCHPERVSACEHGCNGCDECIDYDDPENDPPATEASDWAPPTGDGEDGSVAALAASAEARRAWEQPPCQQCWSLTADEAAQKCLGAAAGDDCHGNHLWPT